ncbi:hypothetical protein GCM10022235_25850 [Kribbella ginsengisoli]|uniref:Uncharacterized protein n=1 Tax=Kribbella ginsengisoli TaxID=363865 RepID=A0ABP6WTX1_9ACTN
MAPPNSSYSGNRASLKGRSINREEVNDGRTRPRVVEVVDASGHPPQNSEETAAQHYEDEGIPFHRAGERVTVNLSESRWQIR